jgi:Tol biopolymer transport system component/DNA-binding winged helix-turn-helix (wHTH) protein
VGNAVDISGPIRFGVFEADLRAGELRKSGVKVKLSGQPFQVLSILLSRPGEVVSREEIQRALWPDTFVDAERNLNTAVNKIREVLGDSAESPRFVETLPRRGYRFIAPVNGTRSPESTQLRVLSPPPAKSQVRWAVLAYTSGAIAIVLLVALVATLHRRAGRSGAPHERTLTRLTFEPGLQIGATWSPDGRYLAYSSNRGGKFDIWVQQVSGGDPIQITHAPGQNWQPDWSPDGNSIVYRSEEGEGGLFVVPALGAVGRERRISDFGYAPHWSTDGSQILFQATNFASTNSFFIVGLDSYPPKPILAKFFAEHPVTAMSAAWHPDGKRVSVLIWNATPLPTIWTMSPDGAGAIKSEIDPRVVQQMRQASANSDLSHEIQDFKFAWGRTGNTLYFERSLGGSKNLWRLLVNPATLRVTGIERLTTGAGYDTEPSVSPDGSKIAFTSESRHERAWIFPFDPVTGRLSANGTPATPPGFEVMAHTITADGSRLAFRAERAGKLELWTKSLTNGAEAPISDDAYDRVLPVWAPDGKHLAYLRGEHESDQSQIAIWSIDTRTESLLTPLERTLRLPYDWTADGSQLLVSQGEPEGHPLEIWSVPVSSTGGSQAKKITGNPAFDLYQPHLSPNRTWIVFEAVKEQISRSWLYVMPAQGGTWIPINEHAHWDDKPRWAPDGRAIYYVSESNGFVNVWGTRFDPASGKVVGQPFQISKFANPDRMIPSYMPPLELSICKNRLVVNLEEASGGIWLLDETRH